MERPGWIGVSGKQFWDYLELLIVPAALALGVYWLNRRQDERDQQAEEERSRRDREAEAARRDRELAVEHQRARDAALQAYLDQMSRLLLDKALRQSKSGDEARLLARVGTLTVLTQLNPAQKEIVLLFLAESKLIEGPQTIINLENADFEALVFQNTVYSLDRVDLSNVNLKDSNFQNVIGMKEANLSQADLTGADLSNCIMSKASLIGADLIEAYLILTNLNEADLRGANLTGADLTDAVGVTNEGLEQHAESLEGTTMPDGRKYEDWLKSQDRGENG